MADLYDPEDAAEFQLVITHNTTSGRFSVEGHSRNRLVAIGMLDYTRQLVNMETAQQRVLEQMQNAPRIQLSKRLVE
jgi:hypothetical protein